MNDLILLTDGSVHTQSKSGHGAYLLLVVDEVEAPIETLRERVRVREFTHTSSTKLELQTLLWALSELPSDAGKFTVYTDSQNIISLQARRAQFEAHNYHSKKGLPLRNTELYQAFFKESDQRPFELIKVQGHKKSDQKDPIDRLFTLVDRASRNARRKTKQ